MTIAQGDRMKIRSTGLTLLWYFSICDTFYWLQDKVTIQYKNILNSQFKSNTVIFKYPNTQHFFDKMPRVLPEYKQQAKHRIIDGALKTFLRRGYKKTTMDNIGKDLGVSKGAVYQYFTSKEDLFLEAFDLYITQKRNRIIDFLKTKGLEGIVSEEFFNLNLSSPNTTDSFTFDLISETLYNQRLNKKMMGYYDRAITNLALFFEEYMKKKTLKQNIDSRKIAVKLLGMREGLTNMLLYGFSLSEVRQVWTDFAETTLNEIKA